MEPAFRLEQLDEAHDRTSFSCGEDVLDRYLKTQATQDIRRRIASCFIARDVESGLIAGYYTLAAAGIPTPEVPVELSRRLPRYPSLPAVRIGRLAVDSRFRGRGLGSALLADAVKRTMESPFAVFALLVDAKNDLAVTFYEKHGFVAFASRPRTLFLPIAAAQKLLR